MTIFAYGQTGSGKTYTMAGDKLGNDGIMIHFIKELLSNDMNNMEIYMSFVQL